MIAASLVLLLIGRHGVEEADPACGNLLSNLGRQRIKPDPRFITAWA